MTDRNKKITVRVSEEELDTIMILAEKNDYENVSEFVRTAMSHFIQSQLTPSHMKSIIIHIPVGIYDRCNELVRAGEASSVEEEIESVFKTHMHNRLEQVIIDNNRMEKIKKIALDRETNESIRRDMDRQFKP
jgi:Arc/MetJ-type ribon-helix-helix transcriptional regulator